MLRQGLLLLNLALFSYAGVYPNYPTDFQFKEFADEIVKTHTKDNNPDWWKTANFYQIYPRSFKDSDGDGIGDLNGITSKLSYLKEIGITATWLSPVFKSPMVDYGYDISNFYEIDPLFGTMKDFEDMVVEANRVGVKIILDFVPNHSSNESEWFKKSIKRVKPYDEYYVWHEGRTNPDDPKGRKLPPSNWISVFRGPAWKFNEERQEYYLHQFAEAQPDFNYRSEALQNEMKKVLLFWLEKGVDGFRIDAVHHVFECAKDKDGNFVNEDRNPGNNDPDDYGYLIHNCTVNQPESVGFVKDWRKVMDTFKEKHNTETKVLLTEQWSPIDIVMQYYGDETTPGAHIPFNFFVITDINNGTNATGFASVLNNWLSKMNSFRVPNWVLGNHDKNRIGSRLGTDRIDMMNMMVMTLPGVGVTYQGEEIGMTDVWISWKDTRDPQACNTSPEKYEKASRDPERTPFQWNDEKNAGFTSGNSTWLPMALDYKKVNVKRERGISRSTLNVYKQLRSLRNDPVFRDNFYVKVEALNDNVLSIMRTDEKQTYITLMNIMGNVETVDLKKTFTQLSDDLEYAVVTDQSPHTFGDKVKSNQVVLLPKEAVVLRTVNSKGTLDEYYHYAVAN